MDAAFCTAFKTHIAGNQSKQRVVAANANVHASLYLCATLANDDVASKNLLATKLFYTKAASGAIAPVTG